MANSADPDQLEQTNLDRPYMPYLTLWDKISQNLAHMEGNSHKKF